MAGSPRARLIAAVVVTPLLVVAACSAPQPGPAAASVAAPPSVPPGGIDPNTRFTPVTAATLTSPAPVLGTDGKVHLAYELVLTNATGATFRLDRLDVLDAGNQQVLLSLSGQQLAERSNPLSGGEQDTAGAGTEIAGSSAAVVWLDVTLPGGTAAPASLRHTIAGAVVAPGRESPIEATVADTATSSAAPVVLGPPLRGGPWYASDGCCDDDTHHRRGLVPVNGDLMVAQRFAVDWYLLDDQHRTLVGDPTRLTSYLSYDQPAIAAADGVVVDTLDGLPETTALPQPPPIPPIADTVGNHVTVMVAPGVYLLYAHFRTGSVAVQRGQQVKRGDVLGHVGSSGNSTTPHLHFQVMTEPTFFPTDSTPYVFGCFDLQGQVTERIWDDVIGLQPTPVLPYVAAPDPGRRTDQMPLDRNVGTFC